MLLSIFCLLQESGTKVQSNASVLASFLLSLHLAVLGESPASSWKDLIRRPFSCKYQNLPHSGTVVLHGGVILLRTPTRPHWGYLALSGDLSDDYNSVTSVCG